ncbi:MAG: biopolymer transporter ExbD [Verrucomicrobiota bacterium]
MKLRKTTTTPSHIGATDESINVSPLIDVVFILLIFFIVTTVFVQETGIQVERPQAASASELSREAILIAVDREGRIYYGGNPIELQAVRPVVKRLLQGDVRPVIIQADRATATEDLVAVIDEINLAGAATINIATTATGG